MRRKRVFDTYFNFEPKLPPKQKKKLVKIKKIKSTGLVPDHGDCGGDAKVLPRQIWQRPREYSDDPVTNPSGIAI